LPFDGSDGDRGHALVDRACHARDPEPGHALHEELGIDRDAMTPDSDTGLVHVAEGLAVACLDHVAHLDAHLLCRQRELVGEPDVEVAVRGLRQLRQLRRLGGPQIPDTVGPRQIRTVVEVQDALIEADRSGRALGIEPSDELGIPAEILEDAPRVDALGAVGDEEVLPEREAGGLLQSRPEPAACGVHRERGLVTDQGARFHGPAHSFGGLIQPAEVGLARGVDDEGHHHDHDGRAPQRDDRIGRRA
jgi:hypothetical protein